MPDIVAGITLAALGIPEVMGYTRIIGTPIITGLYTLFLPVLVFALLGSSRHLVVSADSATAAMVAAGLAALSFTANTASPGMVMFWFGAGLFFANASFFAEQVRKLVEQPPSPVRGLVIDARAVTEMDYSAGEALKELHLDLARAGVELVMIVVPERHEGDLERMGLIDLIGANRIFQSRHACVKAYRSETATVSEPSLNPQQTFQ